MSCDAPLAKAPDQARWYVKPLNRALSRAGARITSAHRRLNLGEACRHLQAKGIEPKTLIDVGVAWGTEDLYESFPDAELLLVEANPQWQPAMDHILESRKGHAVAVGAGSKTTTMTFNVWRGAEGSSSLHAEAVPSDERVKQIEVPIRRLDELCDELGCPAPFVVKIDVQGAEADVIRGMTGILSKTEAIIVETSLFGGPARPEFGDIVNLMHSLDWRLYDIVGFNYRPRDRALGQVDALFVPNLGKARDSHEWV